MEDTRVLRPLALLFALGLVVRVAAWLLTWPTPIVNDEFAYFLRPNSWLLGADLDLVRPPATQLVHAAVIRVAGPSVPAVRGGTVLLGSALVPFVFLIARELGGRRTGLWASGIAAVYPTLVGFSHYLFSETLFLFFSLPGTWLVLRQRRARPLWELALAGALLGLAALTREVGIPLLLAAAAGVAWLRRGAALRALRAASIVLAAAAVVIAPWSAHVYRVTGDVAIVSRTTWMNLYLGNPAPGAHVSTSRYQGLGDTPSQRESEARRLALRAIEERMPLWPIEKLAGLVRLFWPTSYTVKRLLQEPQTRSGGLGHWGYRFVWEPLGDPAVRRLLALGTAASYVAVAVLGTAGLALCPRREPLVVVLLLAAAYVAPVWLTFSNTRFRLPVEVLLIAGAGLALARGPSLWRAASARHRALTGLVAALVTFVIALGRESFLSPTLF